MELQYGKKIIALACLSLSSLLATSVHAETTVETLPIEYRFSYEQIQIPNTESMGVVGMHGLINFTPNWYGGLAVYGGVKGESGGYFALSLDQGYQHLLAGPVWWDIGNSVGTGGGTNTPVGGGLYIEPYAGLSWHFQRFNLGAYYSWIKFVNGGDIDSQQWLLSLSIPFNFDYMPFTDFGTTISSDTEITSADDLPNYFSLLGQAYFPHEGTRDLSNNINDGTVDFIGAEFGSMISSHTFLFGNITGAFHGQNNGYANAFLGGGWSYPVFIQQLHLITRLAVGTGGGGNVNTGGGFLYEPTLGVEYQFTPRYAAEGDVSYLSAPGGDFDAWVLTAALKYYLEPTYATNELSTYKGWRVRLSNETYFQPQNDTGGVNQDMQLINVNIDYWMTRYWYLTGQTAFAYQGENTGGYFSGLVGPGFQFPISVPLSFFIEGLVGTAGGAGLDIAEGALVEPLIGINYQWTDAFGLQLSVGQLIATDGGFNSTVLNVGASYSFATA